MCRLTRPISRYQLTSDQGYCKPVISNQKLCNWVGVYVLKSGPYFIPIFCYVSWFWQDSICNWSWISMQIHLMRSSALLLNRIKSQIPSLGRFKWTTKEPLIVLVFRGVSLQMAILPSGCCFLIVHSSSLSRFVMIKYMENRHLQYITVGAWRQVNLFCCKQRAARRLPISCTRHRRFSRVAAGGAPFTNLYSPRTNCALLCGT